MKGMSRNQMTALARLIARDLSGAPMKIDARSLDALWRRGLVRYDKGRAPLSEGNTIVTGDGFALLGDDDMADEVRLHLRLERDRALSKAGHLEARSDVLRRNAGRWEVALHRRGG